ncbi:hypothetical protein HYALB_00008695 [Hymenoscyphus albidus]|uniref:Uncharacterized protein n=1 Tax=Hymenoscyphus albidus TaxID=595503 RepID=A0A9N9LRW0_9HELO|nr:hypothetical protein HYALB_00008695 [Hymenoscyphus albidus]
MCFGSKNRKAGYDDRDGYMPARPVGHGRRAKRRQRGGRRNGHYDHGLAYGGGGDYGGGDYGGGDYGGGGGC